MAGTDGLLTAAELTSSGVVGGGSDKGRLGRGTGGNGAAGEPVKEWVKAMVQIAAASW
jgi:hypothetical protein